MPAFIDLPAGEVEAHAVTVAGWVAAQSADALVTLRVNGRRVSYRRVERLDLRVALPQFAYSSGVIAHLDLRELGFPPALAIELGCGADCERRTVEVAASLRQAAADDEALRQASRRFCLDRLKCVHCDAHDLTVGPAMIVCRRCRARAEQGFRALNMITARWNVGSNIVATDKVSANPYTPDALALIDRVTRRGGWVLDNGAGSRDRRRANVVNLEIVDYPSTDILAVGESLPFSDASFDAVLSLAVLEHVRDPMACAREILRVLKPGGEILADVPLLQPVHGYPSHYYNMTQQGLAALFGDGAETLACAVPPHGHPIFGVQWLLQSYLQNLTGETRARFAGMTVETLAGLDTAAFLADPIAAELSQAAQAEIACLNSIHLRKR